MVRHENKDTDVCYDKWNLPIRSQNKVSHLLFHYWPVLITLSENWSSQTSKNTNSKPLSVSGQLVKNTVEPFCLLVFECSFISRRFRSLFVVQWAYCHEINETLWAAVPDLYTHTHTPPRCCSQCESVLCCCIVVVCTDKTKALWCWKQHAMCRHLFTLDLDPVVHNIVRQNFEMH